MWKAADYPFLAISVLEFAILKCAIRQDLTLVHYFLLLLTVMVNKSLPRCLHMMAGLKGFLSSCLFSVAWIVASGYLPHQLTAGPVAAAAFFYVAYRWKHMH
eukprot:ANDGO_07764.mRNA.1 hypothetical protein